MDYRMTRRAVLGAAAVIVPAHASPDRGPRADGELTKLTAVEAVAAVRQRTVKAVDLAKAAVDRAVGLKQYNLFTAIRPDKTLAAAAAVDKRLAAGQDPGVLAGLPFVAKDNIDTGDLPTTNGSSAFAGWQPSADAPIVAALRRTGAVLIGKTNMHEFAYGTTSNNRRYGPVRNPYNPSLIPGGSSGGTGAAIGGRVVPAGLGTDTGGSVRIPAALCGCTGFRPTSGRYSLAGIIPLSWSQDTPGPMGRTVADVVLLDSVCANEPLEIPRLALRGARVGVPRAFL